MIRGMRSRQSEMPIPTRTAPRPPGNAINQHNIGWSNNDPFGPLTTLQPVQKKKPPPRPPPPRFRKDSSQNQIDKSKKPTRPTELLTNLFGKKASKQPQVNVAYSGNRAQTAQQPTQLNNLLEGTGSLIDLSPPGSPTFTTRSSSDGVSVDSFGSDGNSNPSMFTSSGNTSQTESAFEDDFDFFGSLSKRNVVQNDPWKGNATFDPFTPISSVNQNTTGIKHVGDSNFFAYNGGSTQNYAPLPINTTTSMPTIIRARPPKPPAPKIYPTSLAPTVPNFNATPVAKTSGIYSSSSVFDDVSSTWPSSASIEGHQRMNSSPPMPSIPPPAPPTEYLTEMEAPHVNTLHVPQGVALYDFEASQTGDLSLKQGDIILLKSKVSDDWLEGQIGSRTGIFPANFIDITVPLPGVVTNIVNALYSFNGETWEDLPFEEGAKITVLSKISDDWLYGEYNGKKGQFPTNYVDRVPHNLPNYS
ncbi:hypothetical protein PV327_008240 [Microctonus hyperodae]|uniref:SH3 domain-containing protein n=1 Tax=Microctonus hyperodae TaxID=165561 RepID=A0AA39KGT0_MICHY|nr:hypothetical protein PV327_008240 [Microctonus hyperodae]